MRGGRESERDREKEDEIWNKCSNWRSWVLDCNYLVVDVEKYTFRQEFETSFVGAIVLSYSTNTDFVESLGSARIFRFNLGHFQLWKLPVSYTSIYLGTPAMRTQTKYRTDYASQTEFNGCSVRIEQVIV